MRGSTDFTFSYSIGVRFYPHADRPQILKHSPRKKLYPHARIDPAHVSATTPIRVYPHADRPYCSTDSLHFSRFIPHAGIDRIELMEKTWQFTPHADRPNPLSLEFFDCLFTPHADRPYKLICYGAKALPRMRGSTRLSQPLPRQPVYPHAGIDLPHLFFLLTNSLPACGSTPI